MKKIISILALLLCVSILSVSVCAVPNYYSDGYGYDDDYGYFYGSAKVEFNSDFSKLYFEGNSFTKFNDATITCVALYETPTINVELTEDQMKTLTQMVIMPACENSVIYADYYLKDGGQISFAYLRNEYIEAYHSAMRNEWDYAKIDFVWPKGNTVTVSKRLMTAKSVTLSPDDFSNTFEVYVPIADKDFGVTTGYLYIEEDKYYYVDLIDEEIMYDDFAPDDEVRQAYEITDGDTCAHIKSALDRFYSDDYGFFVNDNFTGIVADVFWVIFFAVIPLAVLVVFLILAVASKTKYRKFFTVISALAAAELIIFVALTILFTVLKG